MPASKIAEREPEHPSSGDFLRDIVFGANDGVVTSIGFLVGFAGAVTHQGLIVVAGLLEVVAGSASMALGNYLAVKSQKEFHDQMEKIERWEMDNKPEVERKEVEEIYKDMGFSQSEVKLLADRVTADKELWLKVMMRDELGLAKEENGHPVISGIVIGAFFLLGGTLPLLPFMFVTPTTRALLMSIFIAILFLGLIGFFRWFLNKGGLGRKMAETIIIGVIATFIGFVAGEVMRFFGLGGVGF